MVRENRPSGWAKSSTFSDHKMSSLIASMCLMSRQAAFASKLLDQTNQSSRFGLSKFFLANMTSLSTGSPGPSQLRTSELSQLHGGHFMRRIRLASSILELDDILSASKNSMQAGHIEAAARKLGELTAISKATTLKGPPRHLYQRQKIALELDVLSRDYAVRMIASNIGGLMIGLRRSDHQLTESTLIKLAARCMADDGQRLSVGSNKDLTLIVQGFIRHGYSSNLLWNVLSSEIIRREIEPSLMAAILLALPKDLLAVKHEGIRGVVRLGSSKLSLKSQELDPALCVSLISWSSKSPTLLDETEPLVHALVGKAGDLIPRLTPFQVSLLASVLEKRGLIDEGVKGVLAQWAAEERASIGEGINENIQAVELLLKR